MALIFSKLDWGTVGSVLHSVHPFYFATALVFFLISQLISVFRFDIFIRKIGVRLSFKSNTQLYLLGMFYNFFVPGGVGGDAYKAIVLSKSYQKSFKKLGQIVFVDRFLGILTIGVILGILFLFLPTSHSYFWNIGIALIALILTVFLLKLVIRILDFYPKRLYIGLLYSLLIQISQLLCVFFILKSFGIQDNLGIYWVLFLVSSLLSVISFAGLGIRETVFFYGAHLFQFDPYVSTMVGLAFSVITAIISFPGIIYHFKSIEFKN